MSTDSGRSDKSFNADTHVQIGRCQDCDKMIYLSRKVARNAARRYPNDNRPRAYRCPANPRHWHIGHLPSVVRQGVVSYEQWREHKQRKARETRAS